MAASFKRDKDRLALCCTNQQFLQDIHVKQVTLELVMLSCEKHNFLALKEKEQKSQSQP